jgi:hypothetical protein
MATAYQAVSEALGYLRITEDEPATGGGWLRGSDLLDSAAARNALLAQTAEEAAAAYGERARDDVVAGFALHHYAWPATVLYSLPYFLLRRVPRFGPADIAFLAEEGRLTVRVAGFSCLPDDPAAGLPGARTVAGEEALRAELRSAVAGHLEPFLTVFGPLMRRGRRAMWGMATDELTEGLWHVGKLLGQEQRARREAALLLPGRTAPFSGGAGFRTLPGERGAELTTRDRVSCCLVYTVRPAETCGTCPRTCDTERIRRAAAESQ